MPAARVTISIATRNRRNVLRSTLIEIGRLQPPPDEIFVHADGCTDGTEEMLRKEFPEARLLTSSEPRGSVAGRDRILREAGADLVLSLDDDSHPMETDFIGQLRELHSATPNAAVFTFPQVTD